MSRLIEFAIEEGPIVSDAIVVAFCIGAVVGILATAIALRF